MALLLWGITTIRERYVVFPAYHIRGFQSNSAKPKVFCGFRFFVDIWIVDMWITLNTPTTKKA